MIPAQPQTTTSDQKASLFLPLRYCQAKRSLPVHHWVVWLWAVVCMSGLPSLGWAAPHRWTPTYGSPFGINAHTLIWDGNAKAVGAIKDAGIGWVRVDFNWLEMEPTKGSYQWQVADGIVNVAVKNQFNIFATVAYAPAWAQAYQAPQGKQSGPKQANDWEDFVEAVVQRYKGKISHWGIWNEPNLDNFLWFPTNTSRSQRISFYLNNILLPGIRAVKRADPDAVTIACDLAHLGQSRIPDKEHSWQPWMDEILKQAGSQIDVISHHTYQDDYMRTINGTTYLWEYPSVWDTMKTQNVSKKPFWLTEIGWHTDKTPEADQATLYKTMFDNMLGLTKAQGGLWWTKVFPYELVDDPNIPDKWGITRSDWSRKPAWTAYRDYILSHQPVPKISAPSQATTGQVVTFDGSASKDPDGSIVHYSWDWNDTDGIQENATGSKVTYTFTKPGTYRVTLTVTDNHDIAIGTQVEIQVTQGTNPPPIITYDVVYAPANVTIDGQLQEWSQARPITLSGANYDKLTEDWGGTNDLSVEAFWMWSEQGLYFAAKVTDQSHLNTYSSGTLWQGDSIQIAIDADNDRKGPGFDTDGDYEWGLALAQGKPAWEQTTAPTGSSNVSPQIAVLRQGSVTTYEAFFPLAGLRPLQLRAGQKFSLNFLVNDNDGKGRKGWIQWTEGIARSKDPSKYPQATLLPAPTAEPVSPELPANTEPTSTSETVETEMVSEPLTQPDANTESSSSESTETTQEPPSNVPEAVASNDAITPQDSSSQQDALIRPDGCGCNTITPLSQTWLWLLGLLLGWSRIRKTSITSVTK